MGEIIKAQGERIAELTARIVAIESRPKPGRPAKPKAAESAA
jgi:hypothetical protein